MAELDDLLNELDGLSVGNKKNKSHLNPNKIFQKTMEQSPFNIFESIADLGYFSWTPKGPYKQVSDVKDAKEILDLIDISEKPNRISLAATYKLPMSFCRSLPPQKHTNSYPFSNPCLAPIYVATKHRGLDLDDVDFILRGSTLGMLATGEQDKEYLSAFVPGTDAIMVVKFDEYEQDYSSPGFQFERFVTGRRFQDRHNVCFNVHMHLMKVGKYQVLLLGETDAMDDDGPVEVTASNPYWWGSKKMFQLLSSGSVKLCHGTKSRDGRLMKVELVSLSKMIDDALESTNVSSLEQNILNRLDTLKYSTDKFQQTSVPCWNVNVAPRASGSLKLTPSKRNVLFPSDAITKELLF